MPEYRQGTGIVKTVSAIGPAARSDGTPLAQNEVAYFEFDLEYQGGLAVDSMHVTLSDNPATPEWDGEFSETIDIDSQTPGVYTVRYRTVDIVGNKSINSADFVMDIKAPLAPPNPPTGIA